MSAPLALLDVASAARLDDQVPTVPYVPGAVAPASYDRLNERRVLGHGRELFDEASERLFGWRVHTGAGLRVRASCLTVTGGVVAVLTATVGPLGVGAPVRVVEVVDQPRRRGFTYVTLPGHPERGVESFLVECDEAGEVTAHITAASRPDRWFTRLAPPAARVVQRRVTARYLDAFTS